MAVFESPKGFHFSEDGTKPWACFTRVKDPETGRETWPALFRFETDDASVIERLAGVEGVTRVTRT